MKYHCGLCEQPFDESDLVEHPAGGAMLCRSCFEVVSEADTLTSQPPGEAVHQKPRRGVRSPVGQAILHPLKTLARGRELERKDQAARKGLERRDQEAGAPIEANVTGVPFSLPGWAKWLLGIALGITWLCTLWRPPSLLLLLNYPALAGLIVLVTRAACRRVPWPKLRPPVVVASCLVALWLNGWADRYDRRYRDKDGALKVITRGRFSSRWNEKWIIYPAESDSLLLSANGPLSKSGKMHGKWTWLWKKGKPLTYTWHWYGEEITEGEWHLRNK